MPLASYNPGNPAATDAWPIESTLAPLAVGGSQSEAQQMLDMYRNQREAQSNVYAGNLADEHAFAYNQLRQQMQEAYLKAIPENAKAGTLGIMASSPMYAQGFGGADPNVIMDTVARAQALQGAETFQKGATGLNQASQGGYQVNPNVVPGVAGTTVGGYMGPALAQAATIRANATLAAAKLHAATAGGGVSTGMVGTDPEFGTPVTGHAGPKATPDQIRQWNLTHGNVPIGDGSAASAASPGSTTNLPMAKTDTPAPAAAQNKQAGGANLQQQVNANLDKMPKDAQVAIRAAAAKNNGQPVVGTDAQGPYALGANGVKYR